LTLQGLASPSVGTVPFIPLSWNQLYQDIHNIAVIYKVSYLRERYLVVLMKGKLWQRYTENTEYTLLEPLNALSM
jgi:hypothetical protein